MEIPLVPGPVSAPGLVVLGAQTAVCITNPEAGSNLAVTLT